MDGDGCRKARKSLIPTLESRSADQGLYETGTEDLTPT